MKTADQSFPRHSTTRREFLKTTSTLTGAAVLCPLGLCCVARAAEGGTIVIRGHHLFDMLDALGTGKSSHKTLGPVAQKVRANPKAPIKVVIGVDDICAPCEWWDHVKAHCKRSLTTHPEDNANSMTSDKNAIRILGMKPGDTMNADDLYRLIKVRVTKKIFAEEVCVACRLVNKCKETYEPRIEAAVKALCGLP
jgi:hypothetical protein